MDTRTASPPDALAATTVIGDTPFEGQETMPDKISAYYSLVFPSFTYYLQTLSVTIGRRCIPNSTASSSEKAQVDVDLGPLKSVSRLHAKIEYEEEEERFVLAVLGRNGAWVDGAWSGKGSKVPLGERSQIQIASRTFHFVLPPPPIPEDSPSPSSHASSLNRPRSPSVDITSFSPPSSIPSVSPPPVHDTPVSPVKGPPIPDPPQLPNSNVIGKSKQASKKRKASDADIPPSRPKPEVMPPKPQFTYAQLCYRAIKTMGGKGTLQDILSWIKDHYDWYRFNEDKAWEKSVRHNLSSNRAFTKQERSVGERGKGYYWTVSEDCERLFEEQEARALAGSSGTSSVAGKTSGKKPKGASNLEPALKRSVKGDMKGAPLPPPLTSTPLAFRPAPSQIPPIVKTEPVVKTEPISVPHNLSSAPQAPPAGTSASASTAESFPASASSPPPAISQTLPTAAATPNVSSNTASPSTTSSSATGIPPIPASVILPIVVGPVPGTTGGSSPAGSLSAHLTTPPIVLHENQLYLDPTIFAHLTPQQLKELEALGAQKALDILHRHIVQYLKEKIKSKDGKGKGKGKASKRAAGQNGVGVKGVKESVEGSCGAGDTKVGVKRERDKDRIPMSGPFTTVPLPLRRPPQHLSTQASSPSAPVQVPVDPAPPSPLLVVDDDPEPSDGPAAKRRKLEVEARMAPLSVGV